MVDFVAIVLKGPSDGRVRVGAGGEVLEDDHRRVDDFQRGDDVGVGDLLDLIRGDGLHRTGETVLPSGEDAGDDRLLQGLGVQLQVDVQPLALGDAGNLELLGLVAHDSTRIVEDAGRPVRTNWPSAFVRTPNFRSRVMTPTPGKRSPVSS